jgi:hypothetical protein
VESSWLDRRFRAYPAGRPRISTVLLVLTFATVLVLYLILQPG